MKTVQKIISALLLLSTFTACAQNTPHSIVLTFEEYPTIDQPSAAKLNREHEVLTVVNPRTKAEGRKYLNPQSKKRNIQHKKPLNLSVDVFYYGFTTTVPQSGITILPRMHKDPEFFILVCTKVNPIFMLKNTIHHLEISKDTKHAYYAVVKKYDDQAKAHLWKVEKRTIPTDGQLPAETIIIYMQPEDLYLPEGISLTNDSPQAVLPTLYIKDDKKHAANSLAAMEISYLFSSIEPVRKS